MGISPDEAQSRLRRWKLLLLGRFQSNPLEYEAKPLSSFRRNGIQIER